MAKPDVWMPLYIGDYLSDTMHLTTEQHGAYLLLIMAYWKNGGALPASDSQLAAICRMTVDAWSNARGVLADFFDVTNDGKWSSKRVEKEMREAGQKKAKAVQKAANAAAARWDKVSVDAPSIPQAMPEHMLEECPSPSPSPLEDQDQKLLSLDAPLVGELLPDQRERPRISPEPTIRIPYDEILDSFKVNLPGFPQPRRPLDDDRKKAIRAIWVQKEEYGSVDFFSRYFGYIAKSDFLMGGTGWTSCNFDWIFKPKNFRKITESTYHKDASDA